MVICRSRDLGNTSMHGIILIVCLVALRIDNPIRLVACELIGTHGIIVCRLRNAVRTGVIEALKKRDISAIII